MVTAWMDSGCHLNEERGAEAKCDEKTSMVQPAGTHIFLIIVLGPSSFGLLSWKKGRGN